MPKVSPIQTAFNRGEFSPLMYGQIGLDARQSAVALLSNLIALKQGPAARRGGSRIAAPVKDSSKRTALLPFKFNASQAYAIELGDQYMRFFKNNAQVTLTPQNITGITKANPAVINYAGADTFTAGDVVFIDGVSGMTEMNGRWIKVGTVNTGANTFQALTLAGANIDSTGYGTYVSGGTVSEIYELATPYTQANLFDAENLLQMQYAQSNDVMFLAAGKYAPRALARTGDTSWSITALTFNDGPYLDVNTSSTTLTPASYGKATPDMTSNSAPSGWTASGSSSASASYDYYMAFDNPDAGSIWKPTTNQSGYIQIQAPAAFVCDGYSIQQSVTNDDNTYSITDYSPGAFQLLGSNDGTNWTQLDARVGYNGYANRVSDFFEISNTTAYSYYRLNIQALTLNGTIVPRIGGILLSSAAARSITINASSAAGINGGTGFQSTDVGRCLRLQGSDGKWRWFKITAVNSTTQIVAYNNGAPFTNLKPIKSWRLGVYSDTTGWPRAIGFHQNRLVLAGSAGAPDRYDMTIKGGYSPTDLYFQPSNTDGTVGDSDAIYDNLTANQLNQIQWLVSDTSGLLIGTSAQEWIVTSNNTNPMLTPSNRKSDTLSGKGSAYIQPVYADYGAMFLQRARQKIHDIVYTIEQDKTKPRDLTVAAEHITKTQVLGMAYQAEPINVVWGYRGDGLLIGQTYYPDENVFGFHRHPIGGYSDAGRTVKAKVESMCVIPSADATRDELWVIVNRYINGAPARYVEYLTRYYDDSIAQADAFHVDSGLTYDGAPTASVSGLWHLEGETVKAMVDGKSHPDLVVTNGKVTLANGRTGSKINIGLSAPWAMLTLHLADQNAGAAGQGKTKRVAGFCIRLLNTLGLKYGSGPDAQLDEYDFGQGAAYDEVTPLFTGDTEFLTWPEGYEQAGQLYFTHDGVFPACIQALMPMAMIEEV